ncbi:MAG: hypothetical protein ABIO79_16535 [Ferruginibacter sp.]
MNSFLKDLQIKILLLACSLTVLLFTAKSQSLPGFTSTGIFNEQELTISDQWKDVIVNINAPVKMNSGTKTYLVFYALPNGNSIEWTKGKKLHPGDDWHSDIQHIAAQTRYVRHTDKKNNYIIAYVMAKQKSWPAWKRSTPDSIFIIKKVIDSISHLFETYRPEIILNSHSGGGSFIFGYLDAVEKIPANVKRIAFLDSDYGYEEGKHTNKLVNWMQAGKSNKLLVLAYNDSIVIYNGKPLVSATGGTWYRSRLLQRNLSRSFDFNTVADTAFISHTALQGRLQIILKENPAGLIYHTEQVARNGFILSLLSTSKFDRKKYFTYFGDRVYEKFISD